MSPFSIETFAAECKQAMNATEDRQAAAAAYLEETIARVGAEAMIETLQAAIPAGASVGEMIVHASPELTMMFARVPPRFQTGIHDHTVFACIGQLRGQETNVFYEPSEGGGLRVSRTQTLDAGQVLQLPADVVHGIANPGDEVACALHLYGGNFHELADQRSLWDADSHERQAFSFPALVQQSVKTMHRAGNTAGLEAVVEAIPAARPVVEAITKQAAAPATSDSTPL